MDSFNNLKKIFLNKIKDLAKLENLLINFLFNEPNNDERKKLFSYLDLIKIKKNINDTHDFLHMLSDILFNRPLKSSTISNSYELVSYFIHDFTLINKHCEDDDYKNNDINNFFSGLNMFNIFKKNKFILLYLFKNKIINIKELMNYLKTLEKIYAWNKKLVAFFIPEMIKYCDQENDIKSLISDFKINEVYEKLSSSNEELKSFKRRRKTFHHSSIVLKLIRENDVENFINYITQNNFDINFTFDFSILLDSYGESIFESNSFMEVNPQMTIIEYAMLFGSLDIFKYLIDCGRLSKWPTQDSVKFAVFGGNYEIINTISYLGFYFDEFSLYSAIECHRNELFDYIYSHYFDSITKSEEFEISLYSCNPNHLLFFIQRNQGYFEKICSSGEIFFFTRFTPFIFVYNFVLQIPSIDINAKDIVF